MPALREATYPYPARTPKLLGTVIQKYRPRGGAPTAGFQQWIESIDENVEGKLRPALAPLGMLLEEKLYNRVAGLLPRLCLALISDFNTLITKSQALRTPVFALTDQQLGSVGTVLKTDREKREEFKAAFRDLATKIDRLTADADTA